MARRVIAVSLLLVLTAIIWLAPDDQAREGSAGNAQGDPGQQGSALTGAPSSCLPCHREVVDEWQLSMHSQAFTDPQVRAPDQSDNFRQTECIPCHAPRPVFEYGIQDETRVVARVQRRHDGVDCLSCHGLADGQVASTRPGLTGACQPTLKAELSTQALCAPCHNQHDLHDEWRASPAYEAGTACNDCHMPRVRREGPEAGAPRSGRSHRFLGGRDDQFAVAGLRLGHELRGRLLRVSLENTFAGHNLPSDSRNRALDLVVTLFDARGAPLPSLEGVGVRHPGGESGTARLRFRNPYRSSGEASTQLPAGETASLDLPLPEQAARARIEVFYKLQPWLSDLEAHWSHGMDVLLP